MWSINRDHKHVSLIVNTRRRNIIIASGEVCIGHSLLKIFTIHDNFQS